MKNTNESGRSMVEMLGVLAIIGVLSIGGIAGYTMAMNKYQANNIVNAVVQGAISCRTTGRIASDITEDGLTWDATAPCTQSTGAVKFKLTHSQAGVNQQAAKTLGATWTNATTDITYTPAS